MSAPAILPRRRWAPPRHPVPLQVSVGSRLPAETLAHADVLADALGVTRSEVMRAGVELALRRDLSLADEISPEVLAWHRHARSVVASPRAPMVGTNPVANTTPVANTNPVVGD